MADRLEEVNRDQVFIAVVAILFNVRFLFVANHFARQLQQDSWIALIIAGIIAIGGTLAYYLAAKRFPNHNILQYTQIIFGKYLGGLFIIINFIFLILYMSLFLRAFSDGIDSFLLDRTPGIVVMLSFMLVVVYLCHSGLLPMVKMMELLFPVTLFSLILIIVLPLRTANWQHLLPILPEGIGRVFIKEPYYLSSFVGIGLLGFIFPKTNKKPLGLTLTAGILTVLLLKTLLTVAVFSYFGLEELKHTTFPIIYMAKGIEIPGGILERTETFMMLAWIPISFLNIASYFFITKETVAHFFPTLSSIWAYLFLIVIILIIAKLPHDVEANFRYIGFVDYIGIAITFVFNPMMYFVARFRRLNYAKEAI